MTDDTYSNIGPVCPYCNHQTHADEAFYYDEKNFTEYECSACGETFEVEVYTSTSWTCRALAGEKKDD